MSARLEYCFYCGEPTDRAGEDSIYCECEAGPFCEECWGLHNCPYKTEESGE